MNKKWLLLGVPLLLVGSYVFAQNTGVNPPVGAVWTYLGATYGAGWAASTGGVSPACNSIVAYGGVGNDSTDNTGPFHAALAASNCVAFPAGTFLFNSAQSYAFSAANPQAITIQGAGADTTVLHFPNTVGTALTITKNGYSQNVHLRNFTMSTGQTGDAAIHVTQTKVAGAAIQSGMGANDITGVSLRSDEGYWEQSGTNINHVWAHGIWLTNDSAWDLVGVAIYGQTAIATPSPRLGEAVFLEGSNNTNIPVIFNFDRVNFNWLAAGIRIGNLVQGVNISHSNFVGIDNGVWVPGAENNITQVTIMNSQFGYCTRSIRTDSPVDNLFVSNNLIYVPTNSIGLFMGGPSVATTIVGNQFVGQGVGTYTTGADGIYLTPASADLVAAVISGNTFTKLEAGINLLNNVDGAVIYGNVFQNNGITNIQSASTSKFTSITGGTNVRTPSFASVSGAANNGSGLVRLTVSTTSDFRNGEMVLVGAVGGIGGIGTGAANIGPLAVVDATHVDLPTFAFSGAYTSGGFVVTLPP